MTHSTIDRLFIAANYAVEKHKNNPERSLLRTNFIEILIRIAIEKYEKTNKCNTISEAFEMLLQINVKKGSQEGQWQGFRDNLLWKMEVNDVLEANLENLRKIYKSFETGLKAKMNFEDIMTLCTVMMDIGIMEKDLLFLFGMSKMTVVREIENNEKYDYLEFAEFLEFIGRMADFKFEGSELEGLSLA